MTENQQTAETEGNDRNRGNHEEHVQTSPPVKSSIQEAAQHVLATGAKAESVADLVFARQFADIADDEIEAVRKYREQKLGFRTPSPTSVGGGGSRDIILADHMHFVFNSNDQEGPKVAKVDTPTHPPTPPPAPPPTPPPAPPPTPPPAPGPDQDHHHKHKRKSRSGMAGWLPYALTALGAAGIIGPLAAATALWLNRHNTPEPKQPEPGVIEIEKDKKVEIELRRPPGNAPK